MSAHKPARMRGVWVPLAVFAVAAGIYALTITHKHVSFDVYGAYFTAWHLDRTGSPWIDGVTIPGLAGHLPQVLIVPAAHGHTAFGRFPGVIAVNLPAYALAHLGSMSIVPGGLTAAVVTAGTVLLMFLTLRAHLTPGMAFLSTAVFALATPVWSVSANAVWPHTVTIFGIAGMAWASTNQRWWWVGIFGGITLWGRLHAALIVAVLALLVGWRRRAPGIVIRSGTAATLFLAGASVWTHWMYGTYNPLGAYGSLGLSSSSQYVFSVSNYLGMWVSPDRGILIWTPVVVLLVPALVRSWSRLPDWSRSLLWAGLAYTILECALNTFNGGEVIYGYRYGLEFLVCATPALALSSPRVGRLGRLIAGPLLAVELFAYAVGSIDDSIFLSQDVVWRDNAFVHQMNLAGVGGWILVAVVALVGLVVQQAVSRRLRAADASGAVEVVDDWIDAGV